jgi:hypothetical protein
MNACPFGWIAMALATGAIVALAVVAVMREAEARRPPPE